MKVRNSCLIKNWIFEGTVCIGKNQYTADRSFKLSSLGKFGATQSHGAATSLAEMKVGYLWKNRREMVEPYMRLSYMVEKENKYKETSNDGLAFYVDEHTFQLMKYESGIWGAYIQKKPDCNFMWTGKLSYILKNPSNKAKILYAGFQGMPGRYVSEALPMRRNFAGIGLGCTLIYDSGLSISLNYHGELSDRENRHDLLLNLSWKS